MSHPLRCRCGTVQGRMLEPARAMGHGVCYCKDCRAFGRFLGGADLLDPHGGTELVATLPQHVVFDAGHDAIACLSLSPNGLLRWYARCCRTPIANTPRNRRVAYVGLARACLDSAPIEPSFGPVTLHLNRGSATAPVAARSRGVLISTLRAVAMMLGARLGGYRRSPFFDAASGAPVVAPQVLSLQERERLSA